MKQRTIHIHARPEHGATWCGRPPKHGIVLLVSPVPESAAQLPDIILHALEFSHDKPTLGPTRFCSSCVGRVLANVYEGRRLVKLYAEARRDR